MRRSTASSSSRISSFISTFRRTTSLTFFFYPSKEIYDRSVEAITRSRSSIVSRSTINDYWEMISMICEISLLYSLLLCMTLIITYGTLDRIVDYISFS